MRSRLLKVLVVFSCISSGIANAGSLVPVKATAGDGASFALTVEAPNALVDGASVWLETDDGRLLFEGKTTLENGHAVFKAATTKEQLKDGVSVTVFKEGYQIVSVRENTASELTLNLVPTFSDSYNTLRGNLTGFVPADSDDYVQVGLVAKALKVSDLAQMDPASFISPWKDTIDVFGKREIPSNLVLPDQTLSIWFLSVHLDKPEYRLPVPQGSSERYFGITAQAVAQDLVQAVRNKADPYALLDLLEFKTVGASSPTTVPTVDSDIPLNIDAKDALLTSITLQPSPKNNAPEGTKHIAIALSEVEPGVYVPNDIKQVAYANVILATQGSGTRVVDLWAQGADHLRGEWLEKGKTVLPEVDFKTTLSTPSLEEGWNVNVPRNVNMVVGHVEKKIKTSVGSSKVNSLWTVFASGATRVKLPTYALSQLKDKLSDASFMSVDLLEVGTGGYPFIDGDQAENKLRVFEKIRSKIGN